MQNSYIPFKTSRFLFGTCLLLSLTIHFSAFVLVTLNKLLATQGSAINYIDLKDINLSPVTHPPEAKIPAQSPANSEVRLEQKTSEDISKGEQNAEKDQATNNLSDILSTPLGLGMANGYFSSLAEGKTLREDTREYYFELLRIINERWWQKAGTLKDVARRDGIAEIMIGRDGKLYNVKLTRDTGSIEANRAIIEALNDASPFPPLPASYEPEVFLAPLKLAAPLHLFSVRNVR
jgi:protein TonB